MDLQKAGLGKRLIAAIFDGILFGILAVGLATVLSSCFGYDGYLNGVNAAYDRYEAEYGVEFQITQEQYEQLTEEKRTAYDEAYRALTSDEQVLYDYNMLINLTMVILTLSVLVGLILIDFVVPLLFGNGQTLGKKIFGIGLIHSEGIRVTSVQLFARTVLGKFVFLLMIPLSIAVMIFFNSIGAIGGWILIAILAVQVICMVVTKTNSLLHDVLSGTVAVDILSQRIFETREDKIEYIRKLHAEKAARADRI